MTVGGIERLVIFGLTGLVLGGASLGSLRLNTNLYLAGGLWRPIVLHLARLAIVFSTLAWTAQQGAGPLIAAAAGLVIARPIAMRLIAGRR